MTPLQFILALDARGLRFALRQAGKFVVMPGSALTEADRAYLAANRDAVLHELRLSLPLRTPCPVCPGPTDTLCAGCPDLDDYLLPDGRIVPRWCNAGCDVATATHVRKRGETEWTPVVRGGRP